MELLQENHIARIPIAVQNIDDIFYLGSQIIKANRLHLFLLSDSTQIDEDEYLSSLEDESELIVCTEEQIQKLSIYFELKRYLRLKNISHPLNIIFYDAWLFSGWLLFQNYFDVH